MHNRWQGEAESEGEEKEELFATLILLSEAGPRIYGILEEVQKHSGE